MKEKKLYSAQPEPEEKIKVAVIGGSFNPITMGHVRMAENILGHLTCIRQVWLMPAFRHPFEKHKDYETERIRMIRMAETAHIRYFGYEIDNMLSGETYQTFSRLIKDPDYRDIYDFYMVIGSDCLLDFDRKWKYAAELARLVTFIIIPRPGYDPENYKGLLSRPPHILLKAARTPDVSASMVRKKIRRGESLRGLLPKAVETFILEKGLYKKASPARFHRHDSPCCRA